MKDLPGFKFIPIESMTDELFKRCSWESKADWMKDYHLSDNDIKDITFPMHKDECINQESWDALPNDVNKITVYMCGYPDSRVYFMTVDDFMGEIN